MYFEAPSLCICLAILSEPPRESVKLLIVHTSPFIDLCQIGAWQRGGLSSFSDAGYNLDCLKKTVAS